MQQSDPKFSLEGIPHAGLMSSVAIFEDHIVVCDTVGQMVLKLSKETGLMSSFQFSNFRILGLPYWLSFSLESVYPAGNAFSEVQIDHVQHFSLLPGKIDVRLNIDIPEDTELVEPPQEGCIWRQARGTATEVSGAESKVASSEKVGVAQQWYDDLDSLASLTEEMELTTEEEKNSSDGIPQDGKIRIDTVVNTSPGTCEVIVYAALYLKMKRCSNSSDDTGEKQVARIAEILNPGMSRCFKTNACMQLLSASERDVGELVFVRPLHVKLQIDCLDHPKAHNSKDIILTDTSINVNVRLR